MTKDQDPDHTYNLYAKYISPYLPSYILLNKVKDYWLDTNFWW